MTDIFQAQIKHSAIYMMIVGAALFIFGISGGSDFPWFDIMIGDPVIQWSIVGIGLLFIAVGIYLEAKYRSTQNEASQVDATFRDAVKIGLLISVVLVLPLALVGLSSIPLFLCLAFPICTIGAWISLKYFARTRAGLLLGAVFGALLVCILIVAFLIYSLSHWTF